MKEDESDLPGLVPLSASLLSVKRPSQIKCRLIRGSAELQEGDADSIVFQHSVLCQTVMPYRDPGEGSRFWSRKQGAICLEIEAGRAFDRRIGGFIDVGLPYGPKPRLVFYYLNTEALRTRSSEIEVGDSLTAFAKRLGLSGSGRDLRVMKDQLARFSAARFYLGIPNANGSDATIKSDIIEGFDLWFPKDERQRVIWPETVRFSDRYFNSLMAHAVPLNERAVALLSHTAMGLDVYAWLAQRLHRVKPGKPGFVSWFNLKDQFGQGFGRMDNFKRKFRETLRTVHCVYPDACFDLNDEGLIIENSPPPIPCRLLALK
jgi:hypothetical protein